jgi:enoyl-CoA hydratase
MLLANGNARAIVVSAIAPGALPGDGPAIVRTAMNEPSPVLTERRDGILVVTIDRPDARNAVNFAVAEGIGRAMDALDDTAELTVGILTGAGGGFSSGMDLKAFVKGERPYWGDRGFAGICERPTTKPLIAAIEGFAVAGGLEIALACDLIVAARGARLAIPEVKRGLAAGGGGLWRLPRRIPYHVAAEMALTGDAIDAERAHSVGLLSALCEPGEALQTALALAARIAANGPLALAASKRVLLEQHDWAAEEVWRRQRAILEPVARSEDAREGALAFAEKRQPNWRGI